MKKITLLITLFTFVLGFSQAPTGAAPTPPARDAADVISLFTQASNSSTTVYSDISVANFNPNWGSTSGNVTIDAQGGDLALTYPNFDYQGMVIGSNINLSGLETMHIDIWTNTVSPNIYLISNTTGEKFVNVPAAANQWTSVDIPLSQFTSQGLSIADIKELKFATDSGPSGVSIYLDNLYFWKTPTDPATDATLSDLQIDGATISGFGPGTTSYTYTVAPGTVVVPQITSATTTNAGASRVITQATNIPGNATVQVTASNGTDMETYTVSIVASGPPSTAPTPPSRNAADVASIFSDAYTDISVDTYDTSWCGATTTEESISGNAMKKVSGLGCEGIEFLTGRFDASGFTHFHMDIFTETATLDQTFNIKFSNWNNGGSEANAIELVGNNATFLANPNPGTWISIDVPLSDFTVAANNADRNDLVQFIISSTLGTVWYDNLYLYKEATASVEDKALNSFKAYPNPTQDSWTLRGESQIESIRVLDILGKEVIAISPNNNEATIDGSPLKSGIYFAQIKTLEGLDSIKLVKQ